MVAGTAWEDVEERNMRAAAGAVHRAETDPHGTRGRGRATTAIRAAMTGEGRGEVRVSSPPTVTKTSGLVGSAQALCLDGSADGRLEDSIGEGSRHLHEGERANMDWFTAKRRKEKKKTMCDYST